MSIIPPPGPGRGPAPSSPRLSEHSPPSLNISLKTKPFYAAFPVVLSGRADPTQVSLLQVEVEMLRALPGSKTYAAPATTAAGYRPQSTQSEGSGTTYTHIIKHLLGGRGHVSN